MKHLSNNDFNDNLLTNVPDGTLQHHAVNKGQLDTSLNGKLDNTQLDTDGTLSANSDTKIASQKAVKSFVDNEISYTRPYAVQKPYIYEASGGRLIQYEVITVKTFGRFIPGLVKNYMANGWGSSDGTGADLKPVRESARKFWGRNEISIIANAGGFRTAGNIDEVIGLQISNGEILHDFSSSGNGSEALGFRSDGTSQIYRYSDGDTASSMVSDGVVDGFSFGPALVTNGVPINWALSPFNGSYNPQQSARQILAQSEHGDVKIISIRGVTNDFGASGVDISSILALHDVYNAIALDGGGSVQTIAGGYMSHASSSSVPREVPSFVAIDVDVRGSVDMGWVDIKYDAGFGPAGGETNRRLQARRINDIVFWSGSIAPISGSFTGKTWTTAVSDIPPEFIPDNERRAGWPAAGSTGDVSAVASMSSAGILVRPSGSSGWVDLTGISWPGRG